MVGWLPLFHDMGLIGSVLQPLYAAGRCVLMPPVAFLQRPARWLQAISPLPRRRPAAGPTSPTTCASRKIAPPRREGLDLSCWTVAFNGAEPVRAETLERFAEAFAPCGFRREAFYPCYGLAEATLLVTGGRRARGAGRRRVVAAALLGARARAGRRPRTPARRPWSSCGTAWRRAAGRIVDPDTPAALRAGRRVGRDLGRAARASPAGYWNRPRRPERRFRARLDGRPTAAFLRTGDLGFLAAASCTSPAGSRT